MTLAKAHERNYRDADMCANCRYFNQYGSSDYPNPLCDDAEAFVEPDCVCDKHERHE
jgi:hypothetical protein